MVSVITSTETVIGCLLPEIMRLRPQSVAQCKSSRKRVKLKQAQRILEKYET